MRALCCQQLGERTDSQVRQRIDYVVGRIKYRILSLPLRFLQINAESHTQVESGEVKDGGESVGNTDGKKRGCVLDHMTEKKEQNRFFWFGLGYKNKAVILPSFLLLTKQSEKLRAPVQPVRPSLLKLTNLVCMRYCARATASDDPVIVIVRSVFPPSRSSQLEIRIVAPEI